MKYPDLNALDLLAFLFSLTLLPVSIALFLSQDEETVHALKVVDTVLCILLLGHVSLRLMQSENKTVFIKNHWMDVLGSIPMMEPLRFFRLLSIFRIISVIKKSREISQRIKENKTEYRTAIAIIYFMVVMTLGSSMILLFEKNTPASNIKTIADAVWWVFVTISTVGYGDKYPVTMAGKTLAVFVIVSGVGLFGFFISLFTQSFTHDDNNVINEVNDKMSFIHQEPTGKNSEKTKFHHPAELLSTWDNLPISGKILHTKEEIHFSFSDIVWDTNGEKEDAIIIWYGKERITMCSSSLKIILPNNTNTLSPQQQLALSALSLSQQTNL